MLYINNEECKLLEYKKVYWQHCYMNLLKELLIHITYCENASFVGK